MPPARPRRPRWPPRRVQAARGRAGGPGALPQARGGGGSCGSFTGFDKHMGTLTVYSAGTSCMDTLPCQRMYRAPCHGFKFYTPEMRLPVTYPHRPEASFNAVYYKTGYKLQH